MSTAAQVAVFVVAVGSLAGIGLLVRRGSLKERYAVLWLLVGVGLVGLAVARPVVDWVSDQLGITGPTFVLFAGVLFLLAVLISFSVVLSRLEERVRDVIEAQALLQADVDEASGKAAPPVPPTHDG